MSLFSIKAKSDDFELTQYYFSTKSMGMGGAYAAIATQGDSLFFNPANLSSTEGLTLEFAEANFGINGLEIYQTISSFPSSPTVTDYDALFGKNIWFLGSGRATITLPHFGVGYLTEVVVKFYPRNPGFPNIETYYKSDTTYYLGGSYDFNSQISMGGTLKKIQRIGGYTQNLGVSLVTNPSSAASIAENFDNAGTGYGMDLAWTYRFKGPLETAAHFIWRDVGCTSFRKTAGSSAPRMIRDNQILALSTEFSSFLLDWKTSFEYQFMNYPSVDIGKKIHVGTEVSLPLIDLRAGYNQGYESYGLGFSLWLLDFNVASTREEVGVYPGQNGDARIEASLGFKLTLDADFNVVSESGKKRKLKRRR